MVYLKEGRYLGGICARDHDYNDTGKSIRYNESHNCVECSLMMNKKWRKKNHERYKYLQRRWRGNLSVTQKARRAKYQRNYYFATVKPKRRLLKMEKLKG